MISLQDDLVVLGDQVVVPEPRPLPQVVDPVEEWSDDVLDMFEDAVEKEEADEIGYHL